MKQVCQPSAASVCAGFWLLFCCNGVTAGGRSGQPDTVYSHHSGYPMVGICPAPIPVP